MDTDSVVMAALLHDMGNIIKFDLKMFPEFLKPEGYDYWKTVQDEYFVKYGKDEHEATYAIAKEIDVSNRVFELILVVGFAKAEDNFCHDDLEKKICAYSDHRVSPFGILSLDERMVEGHKRYGYNKIGGNSKSDQFERFCNKFIIAEL